MHTKLFSFLPEDTQDGYHVIKFFYMWKEKTNKANDI